MMTVPVIDVDPVLGHFDAEIGIADLRRAVLISAGVIENGLRSRSATARHHTHGQAAGVLAACMIRRAACPPRGRGPE